MSKRSEALKIPKSVKIRVGLRDCEKCVLCGRPGSPDAHYIARSHGGLGIEENIVTLCRDCHRQYDQSIERQSIKRILRDYLISWYPGWSEDKLIYRK